MAFAQHQLPEPIHGRPGSIGSFRLMSRNVLLGMATLVALGVAPAKAVESLNVNLEQICQPMAELNTKFGTSVAPGTPVGIQMQNELVISQAQYQALWSLLKLTPTPGCKRLN